MAKKYYPINIDIEGRDCLVVGGGKVAERKVASLVECGASVRVVAKAFTRAIESLASTGAITAEKREFDPADIGEAELVFCATNDSEVNEAVFRAASDRRRQINVVDVPDLCTFIVPAVIKRGDLVVSVSTSGRIPALAKKLRRDLEKAIPAGIEKFIDFLSERRDELRTLVPEHDARREILAGLIESSASESFVAAPGESGPRRPESDADAIFEGLLAARGVARRRKRREADPA